MRVERPSGRCQFPWTQRRSGTVRRWEAGRRAAFLQGYRDTIDSAPTPLVPADETAFQRALAAWEIDKALYEIAYEARNRPDWLALPLDSLLAQSV